jgi:hypothetical protein
MNKVGQYNLVYSLFLNQWTGPKELINIIMNYYRNSERLLIIESNDNMVFWSISIDDLLLIKKDESKECAQKKNLLWIKHITNMDHNIDHQLEFHNNLLLHKSRLMSFKYETNSTTEKYHRKIHYINIKDVMNKVNSIENWSIYKRKRGNNKNNKIKRLSAISTQKFPGQYLQLSSNGYNNVDCPRSHEILCSSVFDDSIHCYNSLTNTWSVEPFPRPSLSRGSVLARDLYSNFVYSFCGVVGDNDYDSSPKMNIEQYDPITQKWTILPIQLNIPRLYPNVIYIPKWKGFLIYGGTYGGPYYGSDDVPPEFYLHETQKVLLIPEKKFNFPEKEYNIKYFHMCEENENILLVMMQYSLGYIMDISEYPTIDMFLSDTRSISWSVIPPLPTTLRDANIRNLFKSIIVPFSALK